MKTSRPVILFADRDLSWSRSARLELRDRGARVFRTGTVDVALHLANRAPPDVVVLDDELEGSRGRDVVELFQNAHPHAEIILVESRTPETPRGIAHGLFYSGMKPIARTTLLELIEDAVPGRLHEPVSGR
jgi:DNA-binding NtrC family response regulator